MSLATNGLAQPSKACEMGFSSLGRVAPVGRLWYKSAAHPSRIESPSHKLSDTGTPRMHRPPGPGLRPQTKNRKGGEMRRLGDVPERSSYSR
jgi:hypothetical protein